jgi:protocatechuate 4,5-dioxygenase alpha chain
MSDNQMPEGTYKFDGDMATLGFNLNKMCFTFNDEVNREAFRQDEAGYCDKFGLNEVQREAILKRDIITLLRNGGSIYYLAKFAGVLGLNVQDVGGIMTGQTTEEFQAYLDSQKVGKPNG